MFAAAGASGTINELAADVDVCYPQNMGKMGKWDPSGVVTAPAGVCYDPMPDVKNPRSISDQSPEYDAQGK
jgi:hypothetical protein